LPVGSLGTDKLADSGDYGCERRAPVVCGGIDRFGSPFKATRPEWEKEEILVLIGELTLRAVRFKNGINEENR
jgi:hypothetical protein